jgi:hypothetical protein
MSIIVYDIGPVPPQRPEKPQILADVVGLSPAAVHRGHTDDDPRIEPALARYNEALQNYRRERDAYDKERAAWERESGGGAIEISTTQGDIVECGHGRYVKTLPLDVKLGPRSGLNRVIYS